MKYYKVKLMKFDFSRIINSDYPILEFTNSLKYKDVIVMKTLRGAKDVATGENYKVYKKFSYDGIFSSFIMKKNFSSDNIATYDEVRNYILKYRNKKIKVKKNH